MKEKMRSLYATFSASADFTSCLQSCAILVGHVEEVFKMRVVWELQNHLQMHLPKTELHRSQGEAIASMVILSVPKHL